MLNKKMGIFFSTMLLLTLTACGSMTTTDTARVSANERWALLPINNLSTTPRAGEKASALVENHLRAKGVDSIDAYLAPEGLSLVSLLDTEREIRDAKQWARDEGIRYGVTGTIHEWHYKSGVDKEPAIGLSLKLIDLTANRVVWQGTTAKTGWGYANISGVANKAVSKLIRQINITNSVTSAK